MKRQSLRQVDAANEEHVYPTSHWDELRRFLIGGEQDPKELFHLADDVWDVWAYAANGRLSQAGASRIHFGHLRSFLKPYVKWYCYQRLLAGNLTSQYTLRTLPYALTRADVYLRDHQMTSLDEMASGMVFARVWEALLPPQQDEQGARPQRDVKRQEVTRPFWEHLRVQFGAPSRVPPKTPCARQTPTASAADERNIIPPAVIRQLVNKLALHRDGKDQLNRFDHLRLCVLVLTFCTGRRIDELLTAPRATGQEGPLSYYPAKGAAPQGALWFKFCPNKKGPQEYVYISCEWQDITRYCVQTLLRYSDEVRELAPPLEQHYLILVSSWNYTAGIQASGRPVALTSEDFSLVRRKDGQLYPRGLMRKYALGLSYDSLQNWLYGSHDSRGDFPGILKVWNITVDGSVDGEIYRLRTHQARHTRHSALARDPQVSLVARQHDLNHLNPDMQFAYQHVLREQNAALLQKAQEGQLLGPGLAWLKELLGVSYQSTEPHSQFQPGHPSLLSTRWRHLVINNPQFLQLNRVPCGYCTLPQGPQSCEEYMHCLEAEDGGCRWFVTHLEDEQMLIQITRRAHKHRQQAEESTEAGRTVQAGKYEVLAGRAEAMEGEVLRRVSQDMRERLLARKREMEEEQ